MQDIEIEVTIEPEKFLEQIEEDELLEYVRDQGILPSLTIVRDLAQEIRDVVKPKTCSELDILFDQLEKEINDAEQERN